MALPPVTSNTWPEVKLQAVEAIKAAICSVSSGAQNRPIVIITSNTEKELPDAFLRRRFFHFIQFPGKEVLEKTVNAHVPHVKKNLRAAAMSQVFQAREVPGVKEKPTT